MRILILGAGGMLGSAIFKDFIAAGRDVFATARNAVPLHQYFGEAAHARFIDGVDAYNFASVADAVNRIAPDTVINCIGLIRQLPEGQKPLPCIEINARFPHLLFAFCKKQGVRLIHYSTDCVFDGKKGEPYTEADLPSAKDIYGLTKYLGEVREAPALTIRTSIIGHELRNKVSLVEWFLAQEEKVRGFTNAIYSRLPVTEHARILREYILPEPGLSGLYQVAGKPISKYDLLCIIRDSYGKNLAIEPETLVIEDKTLSGRAFALATGYEPPEWPSLIASMHAAYRANQKEGNG